MIMMNDSAFAMAPGKVILFGEHAVVYGQPAIAVPVSQAQAMVSVEPAPPGHGLTLVAEDLGRDIVLAQAPADDPLAAMARLVLAHLNASIPDALVVIRSTIPIASGMGSGAAVSTAIVRALASFLGQELAPDTVSRLVYQVEEMHHGTPSGIDNAVVAFGIPVFFVRGAAIETFDVGTPLHLMIGDTGIASATRVAVGEVRRGWEKDTVRYERVFEQIGGLVRQARELIEQGHAMEQLGRVMDQNHSLLCELDVTSPELERLVGAARGAGALGAKLSGAGRGGNMIALIRPGGADHVANALRRAGAVRLIETTVLG